VHDGTPLTEALRTCAQAAGRALAARTSSAAEAEPGEAGAGGDAAPLDQVCAVLNDHGYEPRLEPDDDGGQRVVMANCPFHTLSRTHTELVCGLNSDLISGLTETLGGGVVTAQLEPAPGRCCVVLRAQDHEQPETPRCSGATEPR
jgi:predicted ArsR family transcriptional regulator